LPELLEITSSKNPRIKHLLELQTKSKVRRKEGLFVIEGLPEIERAAAAGYDFKHVYFNKRLTDAGTANKYCHSGNQPVSVSPEVYEKITYRQSSGGLIAIAHSKSHTLEELHLSPNPLLLIIEAVEKPGNIGALLRTADAAGANGLIICDPRTDIYNPNIIRASTGGIFTVPVAVAESGTVIQWAKSKRIRIFCTALSASSRYDKVDYTKPSAIVMGTEATGLSEKWLSVSDQNIIIPMQGALDSLNVSVSAAIVIFEACRQRDFQ
jgi:TrmH family RNA methyltransferase